MLIIPTALAAQTPSALNGYCVQGAVSALTSGLPSANKLQGVVSQCNVEVYLTGTTTDATIYSDSNNTVLDNPFTADINGKWLFYAATGIGYDVVMSGGLANPACNTAPLCYTTPVTLTDLLVGTGGTASFTAAVNGTPLITANSANFINSSSVTVTNPSTNQIQFTVVNSGGCSLDCVITDPTTINRPPSGNQTIVQQNSSMLTVQDPSNNGFTFTGSTTVPEYFGQLSDTANTFTNCKTSGSETATWSNFDFENYGMDIFGCDYSDRWWIGYNFENDAFSIEGGPFGGGGTSSINYDPTDGLDINEMPEIYLSTTKNSPFTLNAGASGLASGYDPVGIEPYIAFAQSAAPDASTMTWNNYTMLSLSGGSYTLPPLSSTPSGGLSNIMFVFTQITSGTTTLSAASGDTVNYGSSTPISGQGQSEILIGDSNTRNWNVIGKGSGSLTGGAVGSLPYQSAASVTAFIASPTTSGHAFVPMWNPTGSIIAPTAVDLGSYLGTNVTATAPITVTPSTLGLVISCATCTTSATGTNFEVLGGGSLGSANLNATSPSADSGYIALLPKISGANFIIEAPYATGAALGVMQGDASTITMTAGVASCTTATTSQLGCVKPDGTIITDTAGAITVPKTSSSVFGVAEVDNTTITATSGVISAVSKISGGTSGEVAIFGSSSTITSAIALGTAANDIPQLNGSGLLSNAVVNWAAPSAIGTGTPAAGTFSALTLSSITGSAQCLHVNSSGLVSGTGSDCGSGGSGSPGGSSGQIQWNSGGVFAGLTMGGDATIVASTGVITVTKSNGTAFGSAAFQPTSAFQAALGYTPAHSGANSDITSLTGLTTPLSPSQGGTGSSGLTGYLYGNGSSIVTASTTIPGSAIAGNIPGNAANLTGAPTLPNGTAATTQTAGDATTKLATDAFVSTAVTGVLKYVCAAGTITLSGTLASGTTAAVGSATCTGMTSADTVIATFNGNIFTVGGWIPSSNGVLTIAIQPSTNTITINAENNTPVSQTIGSGAVLNYKVIR